MASSAVHGTHKHEWVFKAGVSRNFEELAITTDSRTAQIITDAFINADVEFIVTETEETRVEYGSPYA